MVRMHRHGIDRGQVAVDLDVQDADDIIAVHRDELQGRTRRASRPYVVVVAGGEEGQGSASQPAGLVGRRIAADREGNGSPAEWGRDTVTYRGDHEARVIRRYQSE